MSSIRFVSMFLEDKTKGQNLTRQRFSIAHWFEKQFYRKEVFPRNVPYLKFKIFTLKEPSSRKKNKPFAVS